MKLEVIEVILCKAVGAIVELSICRRCDYHRSDGQGDVYCNRRMEGTDQRVPLH